MGERCEIHSRLRDGRVKRPPGNMARPIQPKTPAEHLTTLSQLLRSVEVDESLSARRRSNLARLVGDVMAEFQKELTPAKQRQRKEG